MQHMDPGESQQEKGLEELWPWKSLPRLKTRSKKSTHTHHTPVGKAADIWN